MDVSYGIVCPVDRRSPFLAVTRRWMDAKFIIRFSRPVDRITSMNIGKHKAAGKRTGFTHSS